MHVVQSVKGEEPAPFLEHAELPGSYHSAHPPIRADQPSPEPPAAAHRAPASTPHPPQPADEPLPKPRLAAPAAAVASAAPATAPASANGRTHGGTTGGGGGGSLRAPSSAPAEDDGSGTDTDEDGELIAKARQKALMERQRAAAVKRRGPGTGDLPSWPRLQRCLPCKAGCMGTCPHPCTEDWRKILCISALK